jgi:hypothetical protein
MQAVSVEVRHMPFVPDTDMQNDEAAKVEQLGVVRSRRDDAKLGRIEKS